MLVFDHTLRTEEDRIREAKQVREPVRAVHNDYDAIPSFASP